MRGFTSLESPKTLDEGFIGKTLRKSMLKNLSVSSIVHFRHIPYKHDILPLTTQAQYEKEIEREELDNEGDY